MGIWVNEGTPTMSFVLYSNNVECMCNASYATWKYRQYRSKLVIFARKYKTLQKINILGARFHSSGTSFFNYFTTISLLKGLFLSFEQISWLNSCCFKHYFKLSAKIDKMKSFTKVCFVPSLVNSGDVSILSFF